jgi:hypothetical protein
MLSSVLAADVSGIWAGEQQGRRGEPEDIAFRLKLQGDSLTGTLFGDEIDLPIGEASVSGDQVRFTVTVTNFYSGNKTKYVYTGTVKGSEMELVRERIPAPEDRPPAANRPPAKQTLKLKRIG